MKFGELALAALLCGVPLLLVSTTWRRYLAVDRASVGNLFQMRAGLTLISLSTSIWFAVLALMILEDHSAEAKSWATNLSPAMIGLINLLFCVGGLICAGRGLRSAQQTGPIRRSHGSQQWIPHAHLTLFIGESTLRKAKELSHSGDEQPLAGVGLELQLL